MSISCRCDKCRAEMESGNDIYCDFCYEELKDANEALTDENNDLKKQIESLEKELLDAEMGRD